MKEKNNVDWIEKLKLEFQEYLKEDEPPTLK
jgi:hypothetical protein